MNRVSIQSLALSLLFLLDIIGSWALARSAAQPQGNQGEIARGKYLVEEVARCGFCHTPRDDRGQSDRSRWLQGGALWFIPARPVPDWTESVPAIAGLGGFDEGDILHVLETGVGPNGHVVRSPMPVFHMTATDAKAIVAYLKTLPNPPH